MVPKVDTVYMQQCQRNLPASNTKCHTEHCPPSSKCPLPALDSVNGNITIRRTQYNWLEHTTEQRLLVIMTHVHMYMIGYVRTTGPLTLSRLMEKTWSHAWLLGAFQSVWPTLLLSNARAAQISLDAECTEIVTTANKLNACTHS